MVKSGAEGSCYTSVVAKFTPDAVKPLRALREHHPSVSSYEGKGTFTSIRPRVCPAEPYGLGRERRSTTCERRSTT